MASEYPQFIFWSLIKKYKLTVLLFVRPIRDGYIDLYRTSIGKLLIIVHALGFTNYEKWLTIITQDLVSNLYLEFKRGNWIFKRTSHVFSAIVLGQSHEQLN